MPTARQLQEAAMAEEQAALEAQTPAFRVLEAEERRLTAERDRSRAAHPEVAGRRNRLGHYLMLLAIVITGAWLVDVLFMRSGLTFLLPDVFSLEQANLLAWLFPLVTVAMEAVMGWMAGLTEARAKAAVAPAQATYDAAFAGTGRQVRANRPRPHRQLIWHGIAVLWLGGTTALVALGFLGTPGHTSFTSWFAVALLCIAAAVHLLVLFMAASAAVEWEESSLLRAFKRSERELARATAALDAFLARHVVPPMQRALVLQRVTANDPQGPVALIEPTAALRAMITRAIGRAIFPDPAPPQPPPDGGTPSAAGGSPAAAGDLPDAGEPEAVAAAAGGPAAGGEEAGWRARAEQAEAEARRWEHRFNGEV